MTAPKQIPSISPLRQPHVDSTSSRGRIHTPHDSAISATLSRKEEDAARAAGICPMPHLERPTLPAPTLGNESTTREIDDLKGATRAQRLARYLEKSPSEAQEDKQPKSVHQHLIGILATSDNLQSTLLIEGTKQRKFASEEAHRVQQAHYANIDKIEVKQAKLESISYWGSMWNFAWASAQILGGGALLLSQDADLMKMGYLAIGSGAAGAVAEAMRIAGYSPSITGGLAFACSLIGMGLGTGGFALMQSANKAKALMNLTTVATAMIAIATGYRKAGAEGDIEELRAEGNLFEGKYDEATSRVVKDVKGLKSAAETSAQVTRIIVASERNRLHIMTKLANAAAAAA